MHLSLEGMVGSASQQRTSTGETKTKTDQRCGGAKKTRVSLHNYLHILQIKLKKGKLTASMLILKIFWLQTSNLTFGEAFSARSVQNGQSLPLRVDITYIIVYCRV